MDKNIKTIAIQKREFAMNLIKKDFEILNVLPSRQNVGSLAYIFEKTDAIEAEFSKMLREYEFSKNAHGLTLYDIRTMMDLLSGLEVSKEDTDKLNDKLCAIEEHICGNSCVMSIEELQEEYKDKIDSFDVDALKRNMTGNK